MSIEQTDFLTTIEPLDGDRPERKKELSTAIDSLDEDEYLKVVQIIDEGTPDLQNSEEEVDVHIEGLSPAVLTKLWNFVVVPQQAKKATVCNNGPESTSGNASKGGVKRKAVDEELKKAHIRKLQELEKARIRKFQEQLKLFISSNGAAVPFAET